MSDVTESVAIPGPRRPTWLVWTIGILFGVLYVYFLYQGIGNLIGVPQSFRASYNFGVSPAGWVILIVNVLVAPAAYGVCLLLTRRRGIVATVVIFVAGLCILSAVFASLSAAPGFIDFIGSR